MVLLDFPKSHEVSRNFAVYGGNSTWHLFFGRNNNNHNAFTSIIWKLIYLPLLKLRSKHLSAAKGDGIGSST